MAIPYDGYKFVKWNDTENTDPQRTDTNILTDIDAKAIFEKITFNVKYAAEPNGYIKNNIALIAIYNHY